MGKAKWKKLSDTNLSKGDTTSDEAESDFHKDNLEDIFSVLKPFNDLLLKEELTNPELLEELFSLDISDLLEVFYHFLSESDDMEQTVSKMIVEAKQHGVQKILENALKNKSEDENDNLVNNFSLETITKFLASYKGIHEVTWHWKCCLKINIQFIKRIFLGW